MGQRFIKQDELYQQVLSLQNTATKNAYYKIYVVKRECFLRLMKLTVIVPLHVHFTKNTKHHKVIE